MQELVVERINEGLAFYAQGRIEDAVRAWVDAKRVGAGRIQPRVDEYLAFVREILPAVHEALEAELGPFLEPPAPAPPPEPPPPIALPESAEPGGVIFDVDTAEIFATADLDAVPGPIAPAAPPAPVVVSAPAPAPPLESPPAPQVAAAPLVSAASLQPTPPQPTPPSLPTIELDVPTDTAGESLPPATVGLAATQQKAASTQSIERPRHGAARTPARAVVVRAAPGVARLVTTRTQKSNPSSGQSHAGPEALESPSPAAAMTPSASAAPGPTSHGADPWGSGSMVVPDATVDAIASGFSLVAAQPVSAVEPMQEVGAASELARHEARLIELEELDDFSGVIATAKAILSLDADHARAQAAQKRARERLSQMHASRLGSLDTVPVVLVAPDQVIWLDLDQRAGFILSQVDGFSSFEDILEISGMDRLEVLAILARLVDAKVIGPASSR